MEAFDQTNGSGGLMTLLSHAIGYRSVNLQFNARYLGSSIDFIVNIYGEPVTTNDWIQGELNENSILLGT